jgi:hypothetical protein
MTVSSSGLVHSSYYTSRQTPQSQLSIAALITTWAREVGRRGNTLPFILGTNLKAKKLRGCIDQRPAPNAIRRAGAGRSLTRLNPFFKGDSSPSLGMTGLASSLRPPVYSLARRRRQMPAAAVSSNMKLVGSGTACVAASAAAALASCCCQMRKSRPSLLPSRLASLSPLMP